MNQPSAPSLGGGGLGIFLACQGADFTLPPPGVLPLCVCARGHARRTSARSLIASLLPTACLASVHRGRPHVPVVPSPHKAPGGLGEGGWGRLVHTFQVSWGRRGASGAGRKAPHRRNTNYNTLQNLEICGVWQMIFGGQVPGGGVWLSHREQGSPRLTTVTEPGATMMSRSGPKARHPCNKINFRASFEGQCEVKHMVVMQSLRWLSRRHVH